MDSALTATAPGGAIPGPSVLQTTRNLLVVAAKYAWRHRGRTALIASVVAFGNFVMLFQLAQGAGQERAFVRGMIGTMSGHVQVHARDAAERSLFSADIENAVALPRIRRLEAEIRRQPEVAATARRIRFPAMMSRGNDSWGSFILGVQPAAERQVSDGLRLARGRFVRPGANEIVIGHDLADKRHIRLGDELVLLGSTVDGSFNGMSFQVVGVLSGDGLARFYSSMAYVPIDRAKQLIALEEGEAYDLVVRLHEGVELEPLVARLRARLPGIAGAPLAIETWRDTGKLFQGILKVGNGFRLAMAAGLGLIIGVLVFTSLSVYIHERGAEISTLLAVGFQQRQLLVLFVAEAVFVTAGAALVGLALGALAVSALGRVGIPAFNEAMTYVFAGDRLYPILRLGDVAGLLAGTAAVGFLASVLPAWRAAGMDPARALNRS